MLWPPPKRWDEVELACTCRAIVVWRMPVMFLFFCRIDQKGTDCQRSTHKFGGRVIKFLETITRQL